MNQSMSCISTGWAGGATAGSPVCSPHGSRSTSPVSGWLRVPILSIRRSRRELRPALVIGESLGCIHAIRLREIPHILVSPALGAPACLYRFAPLMFIPGIPWLCGRIWRPREGDRQPLRFRYRILRNYKAHWADALANTAAAGSTDPFFAFFGTRDHYRRTGIVRISAWRKYFGDSFQIYDGTHFMEEEYVYSMLAPKILSTLHLPAIP